MRKLNIGRLILISFTFIFLILHLNTKLAWPSKDDEVHVINWKEKVVLTGEFVVREGDKLVVWPGTEVVIKPDSKVAIRVLGRLEVKGEKGKLVKFYSEGEVAPGKWGGIFIVDSRENSIQYCSLVGASSGISLVNSSVSIQSSTFENCRQAVQINQKSLARVKGCSFRRNLVGINATLSGRVEVVESRFESIRDTGIIIQNGGSGRIEKCEITGGKKGMFALTNAPVEIIESAFTSCEQGAIFRQVGKNSYLKYCRFENNSTGVLSVQFAYEEIFDSTFENNLTAIDVREFSSPHVTHNKFIANKLGINLIRKSNSLIDFNVFINNRTGIMINFSSYPGIFNNNFERNDLHIKIGEFQSGNFENNVGSKDISGKEAAKRGSRNIGVFSQSRKFPERINAKGNFWGTDLGEFEQADLNLERIYDGKDFGPMTYEGFGEEKYKIDHVDFSEWKREPVKEAGIREKVEK